MIECKHDPLLFHAYNDTLAVRLGGQTRSVYRCKKCNKDVYRPKPWLDWEELEGVA